MQSQAPATEPHARRQFRSKYWCLLATLMLMASAGKLSAQTVLPADVMTNCTVSAVEFANWFESGSVTLNGIVDPADSITFPDQPNCTFYKWSEQMFLWLTSPAPSRYGPGTHVFNSPVFYDLSPPDATSGERTLIPNAPGRFRNFSAQISQVGPQGKRVVFDQSGRMFTVVHPEAGADGKPLIRDKSGRPVTIARTQVSPNGRPVFLDKAGKAIDFDILRNGNPRLLDKGGKPIDFRAAMAVINGRPFFLDTAGNAIDTEQAQADGSVLIAQNGSLVYYALQVNDVYAYFLTGQKTLPANGGISPTPTHFPTTPSDLNKIKNFGLAHSKAFPDPNALAVELKSSWIEATGVDANRYVTMTATVPTFDKTDPQHWVHTGSKQVKLAMTGLHVVGSTAGHPEMIWATFEHVDNTRNAPYSYINTANATINVAQNNGGAWTFSTTPPGNLPNQQVAGMDGADVAAITSDPIGPSDVLRLNPWGSPGSNAAKNTEVISINNSVIGKLAAGDVRKNYIMTGSTWTIGGAPPNAGNQVGTNKLANSTMETFFQQSNCFSCHSDSGGNMLGTMFGPPPVPPVGDGLSHVFAPTKPLF